MTEGKRARFLRGWPTSLVLLATVITLSTLAACGDDDDASTAQPNDVPSAQTTQNDTLPTADPAVDTGPSSVEVEPDLVDSKRHDTSTLQASLAKSREALSDIKIIYAVSISMDGDHALSEIEEVEAQITTARRAPLDYRYEFAGLMSGEEISSMVISTADATYVCEASSTVADGTCFAVPTGEEVDQGLLMMDGFISPPDEIISGPGFKILRTSKETIAGFEGSCYIANEPNLGETEFCISDNGLVLRMSILGSKVEAISVSEPTDDDFECCPFPVVDMGDIFEEIIEGFAPPEDSGLPSR